MKKRCCQKEGLNVKFNVDDSDRAWQCAKDFPSFLAQFAPDALIRDPRAVGNLPDPEQAVLSTVIEAYEGLFDENETYLRFKLRQMKKEPCSKDLSFITGFLVKSVDEEERIILYEVSGCLYGTERSKNPFEMRVQIGISDSGANVVKISSSQKKNYRSLYGCAAGSLMILSVLTCPCFYYPCILGCLYSMEEKHEISSIASRLEVHFRNDHNLQNESNDIIPTAVEVNEKNDQTIRKW